MITIVVGVGEVGSVLLRLLKEKGFDAYGVDKDPKKTDQVIFGPPKIEFMHICFPFFDGFEDEVKKYIKQFKPEVTIINSTVPPGTTRKIWEQSYKVFSIVHSPVRGQHNELYRDLKRYDKWIGYLDDEGSLKALHHFLDLGLKVVPRNNPEITELVKLLDTTQYSLLIAWAQECERVCKQHEVSHQEVRAFGEQTQKFYNVRPDLYAGVIGGTCCMPNVDILLGMDKKGYYLKQFLENIKESNRKYHDDSMKEGYKESNKENVKVAEEMEDKMVTE